MLTVCVTWQNEVLSNIEIDTNQPPVVLKEKLYLLTGVPKRRQNIIFQGVLIKDDTDWATVGIKDGQTLLMLGCTDEIVNAPEEEQFVIVDDSADLYNQGNTSYMISTVMCLYFVPELQSALLSYTNASGAKEVDDMNSHLLALATNNLFKDLDLKGYPPDLSEFVKVLYVTPSQFPQVHNETYMLHIAEEVWEKIMLALYKSLGSSPGTSSSIATAVIKTLFWTELVARIDHFPESQEESYMKKSVHGLQCPISSEVNNLYQGVKLGLKLEHSQDLGRTVGSSGYWQIAKLPKYLAIFFPRFFWRSESNQWGKKLKRVEYPLELDVYEYCTDELKQQLQELRRAANAKFALNLDGKNDCRDTGTEVPARADAVVLGGAPAPPKIPGTSSDEGKAIAINIDTPRNKSQVTGIYDLVALLTHKGSGEHHNAFVKQEAEKWIEFDDHVIRGRTVQDVTKLFGGLHTAYICLYKARLL